MSSRVQPVKKHPKRRVYLDFASATPLNPKAKKAMLEAFSMVGNPSSSHDEGRAAAEILDSSRKISAEFLGARPEEIIFTSGATEADNLALRGICQGFSKGKEIIIGASEHPAVVETAKWLKHRGVIVKIAPIDKTGRINLAAFEKLLSAKTILVSVAAVNHEAGTIQPIAEIARKIKKFSAKNGVKIFFHTDASHAAPLSLNVSRLGVDMLTLDSNKVGGPPGAGLLYIRRGTPLSPLILGGGQERGYRAGTENLPAIVGFGAALRECAENLKKDFPRLIELRKFFLKQIKDLPVEVNGREAEAIPNIINLHIDRNADYFVEQLNTRGIAVSARSACRSGERSSDVVKAMGFDEKYASQCIRISFGVSTKKSELLRAAKAIATIISD